MELVETIENLNETETTKEEKRIFKSYCLADHTFDGIMEKYDSYCFNEQIPIIRNIGVASYSSTTFKIIFLFKEVEKKINLFNSVMEIANFDEVDYKHFYCQNEEENKKTIDYFLTTKSYDIAFIEAEMNTKYYKNISLNIYDEDEDDEEEYDDYLPPLELPFFQDKCIVCMEYKPSILILPCLHICHCITCDEEGLMNKCPLCREKIERKIVITK